MAIETVPWGGEKYLEKQCEQIIYTFRIGTAIRLTLYPVLTAAAKRMKYRASFGPMYGNVSKSVLLPHQVSIQDAVRFMALERVRYEISLNPSARFVETGTEIHAV